MTDEQQKPPRSRGGRIFVFALFWLTAAYFVVVIVGSLGSSLYGSAPVKSPTSKLTPAQRTWCVGAADGLLRELEGQVALELQHPWAEEDPLARWHTWQQGWQSKLRDARSRCVASNEGPMHECYAQLTTMHRKYAAALTQFVETRRHVRQAFDDSLRQLKRGR